jgi:uncharacterized membrane protein YeiH
MHSSLTSAHELPASFDVAAMVVAAAFGAHLARRRRFPVFGVLLGGVVVGLGGGMVRDVLLGLEAAAITTWYYIPAVLIAAIIIGFTPLRLGFSGLAFVAVQGVSIGLLVGIGVQKAVEYRAPGPSAILLGVITGTFGGALGDVLAGERAAIMREGHWLLIVVVCGAVVFYPITLYVGFHAAVVVTVLVVAGLRVLSVRFNWTTPVFPGDDLRSGDP